MKQLLGRALFGTFTVHDLLIAAAGIAVVVFAAGALMRVLRKKGTDERHYQTVRCSSCGWQGEVSRHAGRCPKCNRPLGDRKAERQTY